MKVYLGSFEVKYKTDDAASTSDPGAHVDCFCCADAIETALEKMKSSLEKDGYLIHEVELIGLMDEINLEEDGSTGYDELAKQCLASREVVYSAFMTYGLS